MNTHLIATIQETRDGDGVDVLRLVVTDADGSPYDEADQLGATATIEVTPAAMRQLVAAVNVGRVAQTELRDLAGQLDTIAGAMEADAPKAARGRRRRAIQNRASAYRNAADLTRVRLRRGMGL